MWHNRHVLIIGIARQGLALARYLARRGAQVTLNDRRPLEELQAEQQALADLGDAGTKIAWIVGGHPLELLQDIDLVCISGGVPLSLPIVQEAQRRGIPLSNDSQIFLEAAPCPVIGITGSAGKTTTTTLVGRMARAAAEMDAAGTAGYIPSRVWVGGNIGSPLLNEVDQMQPDDLAVMELSSFQLEIMTRSPQVAAVLNITPNHLDRHGTMDAYREAKARILAFQSPGGVAVLGRDDPGAWSLAGRVRGRLLSFGLSELPVGQEGVFLKGENLTLRLNGAGGPQETLLMAKSMLELRGEHNLLNLLCACAIAAAVGLPPAAMQAGVQGFHGVPHRLEYIRTWKGARWYNDSIATAPERALAAVRSFHEPLVLLAGGRDKNLPWEEFAREVVERVDHLVLFGEAAGIIEQALTRTGRLGQPGTCSITRCKGLKDAVQAAAALVEPGDVVLLSPGGTSFDEFQDFEERGQCFVQWVKDLN